jgi:hypothetical protein
VNWVSPAVVDKLSLPVCDIESPRSYKPVQGSEFIPTEQTNFTLTGQTRKSSHDVFLVAPEEFPVEGVVVGTDFIQKFGHVHVLFAEKLESEEMMLVVQSKVTVGTKRTSTSDT